MHMCTTHDRDEHIEAHMLNVCANKHECAQMPETTNEYRTHTYENVHSRTIQSNIHL